MVAWVKHILQRPSGGGNALLDLDAFFAGQIADLQHAVDEEPQALLGGHPAGAGVGRIKQAHPLQIGHDIADRGGGQRQRQPLGERARAHRLARGEIGFDQMAEHLAGTAAELARQKIALDR